MPPFSISDDAKAELEALADWMPTSEMRQVTLYASVCTDNDRFDRLQPFLEKMGLWKEDFPHSLFSIAGYGSIPKHSGFDHILFPLSGSITISNTFIQPGEYMRYSTTQTFIANLDLLIVLVPEADQPDSPVPKEESPATSPTENPAQNS
ncbi:hypothetical protein GX48_00549 [Paracoccidioides brasiliensis]|nr:hypothetical protein GX48_00549 [Paracoccidioides brasiliensis]